MSMFDACMKNLDIKGDAPKPHTFILYCQLFRTKIQPLTQGSLPCARIKPYTPKKKLSRTPPAMGMPIFAQHNNQPTIPGHSSK